MWGLSRGLNGLPQNYDIPSLDGSGKTKRASAFSDNETHPAAQTQSLQLKFSIILSVIKTRFFGIFVDTSEKSGERDICPHSQMSSNMTVN
jgi:hypothetical protein